MKQVMDSVNLVTSMDSKCWAGIMCVHLRKEARQRGGRDIVEIYNVWASLKERTFASNFNYFNLMIYKSVKLKKFKLYLYN